MAKRLQVYATDDLVVTFDPNVCVHSAVCLRTLPAVFDVTRSRWVAVTAAPADDVAGTVAKCPSGALQVVRAGRPPASPPPADRVELRVNPDGALVLTGGVRILKEDGQVVEKDKCSLCRCGHTANPPFCDASHRRVGFRSP